MNATAPPPPKIAPTSAPGVHEIATFLPGRLEFEHELDNDAEDLVKDLEFGVCLEFGGDEIIEDENDLDVRARIRWEEERSGTWTGSTGKSILGGKGPMPVNGLVNGVVNGYHPPAVNGDVVGRKSQSKSDDVTMTNGNGSGDEDGNVEEPTQPPPIETQDSINFKLTLLEMYFQRVGKRLESKAIIFDRGLLEYKKVCAFYTSGACVFISFPRCKQQRRSGPERKGKSSIALDHLPDFKPPKISRHLQQTYFVSTYHCVTLSIIPKHSQIR
jgi:transcriptional adapter 2-alpha